MFFEEPGQKKEGRRARETETDIAPSRCGPEEINYRRLERRQKSEAEKCGSSRDPLEPIDARSDPHAGSEKAELAQDLIGQRRSKCGCYTDRGGEDKPQPIGKPV